MDTLPYLLPWILLLLAIGLAVNVSLLPIKSIPGIAVTSVLGLLMLLVAIYGNLITHQQFDQVAEKKAELANMEAWKYRHLDELSLLIAQLKPPETEDLALMDQLRDYGWRPENANIQRMLAAHQSRERVRSEFEPTGPMLIKGIPTDVNDAMVSLALRQVGFTVIPYREDEEAETRVNIIHYGRDMDVAAIKLAALTLIRAGVVIKGIKPFPKPTQGNLRAIKIEWNKYYQNRDPLEPDEIEAATSF